MKTFFPRLLWRNLISRLVVTYLLGLSSSWAIASELLTKVNEQTHLEIQHLLHYVKTTPCSYDRNGRLHTGKEAVEHITKKYNYFEDDITTAEDFIELSASKSTLSGKPYLIHCPDQPTQFSHDWLLQELHRFRQK